MHETIWNPKATRKAAPTRHRAAERRLYSVGSSKEARLFGKFGLSLAADVPARRRRSHEGKAGTGASAKTDAWPKEVIDTNFTKRASFAWIPHRFVDPKAYCRGDREKVRCRVSSQSSLALSNGTGLELPEARKAGQRVRREGDTALETLRMAAYKKTRIGLAPIWYFLTKAASFWFPISGAHGRRGVKLPICLSREIGQRYRQYPPLAFLPKESASPCTSDSIPVKTSRHRKSKGFCTISCVILMARLFFCGIRAWFIELPLLRNVLNSIIESTRISFPVMRLNLTLLNLYGRSLKELLRTLFPRIWSILKTPFYRPCVGFAIRSVSYGHASGHRICPGDRVSITYA